MGQCSKKHESATPILLQVSRISLYTNSKRSNTDAIIGLIITILAKQKTTNLFSLKSDIIDSIKAIFIDIKGMLEYNSITINEQVIDLDFL